jgi:ribosomal protein S18 acetylase RimI-like enzyme
MEVDLRLIESQTEAHALSERIDRCAAESMAEYRDTPLPERVGARFIAKHFDERESVLLVAESQAGQADLGLCLVGPFEDPLTAERVPMVLVLHVDPSVRHRGLARAMVQEARSILAERGFRSMAARAAHNDDALISMGERWGYVRQWELMLNE